MKRMRVGRRVARHVYDGDEPVFTAPTEKLAYEVVTAVNLARAEREHREKDDRAGAS